MPKGKPENALTRDGAEALAWAIADKLENLSGDWVADFVLLLRWVAYKATRDDAETVYIVTEKAFAVNFDGVEEAATAHMQKRAEEYGRLAKRGGAR
jgi:hypothetical protein